MALRLDKSFAWVYIIINEKKLLFLSIFTLLLIFAAQKIQGFSSLSQKELPYVADEVIVKFKKDDRPFRVMKVPSGKVQGKD